LGGLYADYADYVDGAEAVSGKFGAAHYLLIAERWGSEPKVFTQITRITQTGLANS
jgi:hypothetical protein